MRRSGSGYGCGVDEQRKGAIFGAAAYLLWGAFPLYWPLLAPAKPVEILAHRIAWSLLVIGAILLIRRGVSWIRDLGGRRLRLLSLAALIISANWGTYIYGVNNGFVVETSLGYFINPLVTVMFGVLLLGERLRRAQWIAITIAAIAVTVLTLDYGRPPWIAIILAFSFGTYGLLKKQAGVGAVESLAVETAVLFVPAVTFLFVYGARGEGTFMNAGWDHAALLATTGVVSVIPLLFFGAAAIRVPLTTIGLLQYLAPILQFLIGVAVRHEEMPASRWAGFVMVWIALIVLTVDALHGARKRQLARAAESVA
ncbi:MAG TPA: EamA family transporter RarD [Actinomycetota bacterium]|nr:EamA family transporter RarD [Actinomycetota bacterium]